MGTCVRQLWGLSVERGCVGDEGGGLRMRWG